MKKLMFVNSLAKIMHLMIFKISLPSYCALTLLALRLCHITSLTVLSVYFTY